MKRLFIAGVCLSMVHLMAAAQEEPASGFKNTLSAGATLTDGNSETLQVNVGFVTEGERKGLGSVRAGLEGNYGESTVVSNKETTVENLSGFVNVKKTISTRTFGSVNGDILYDDIAQIDYHATLGPGVGAYLVKNDETALSFEAGPSYVWEKVADVRDEYLALRFAERVDHALSKTAKVWQSLEYLPKADDFGDYLLSAELGVEAAVNASMSLRLVLQDKYDITPGTDLEKNDLALIAGISVSL